VDSREDELEGKEMKEYTDLVERLRRDGIAARDTLECAECAPTVDPNDALEAADAIKAQAKRIAELEVTAQFVDEYIKEAGRLDARIAELEAALNPLAEVAERYAYCKPRAEEDDVVMFELMYFNQARKVLGEKK